MYKKRSQDPKLSLRGAQRRGNLVGMTLSSEDRHASLAMTTCFEIVYKTYAMRSTKNTL